jgi:hypothetical protein
MGCAPKTGITHVTWRGVTATMRSMPSSRIPACGCGLCDNSFHGESHVWSCIETLHHPLSPLAPRSIRHCDASSAWSWTQSRCLPAYSVTLHLGDPFAAGRRQRGHRVEQAATVTDADHQRQHAAGPTGGSRAACHLSDAIFTHPLRDVRRRRWRIIPSLAPLICALIWPNSGYMQNASLGRRHRISRSLFAIHLVSNSYAIS